MNANYWAEETERVKERLALKPTSVVALENRVAVLEGVTEALLGRLKNLEKKCDCCVSDETRPDNGDGNSSRMAGDSVDSGTGE